MNYTSHEIESERYNLSQLLHTEITTQREMTNQQQFTAGK